MLKPWQKTGAEWLAGQRLALLADEMRVGKTLTAVEGARLVAARRVLVLCPGVARLTWERAFETAGREARVARTALEMVQIAHAPGPLVMVSSYALVPGHECEPWDLLILDESHFLRNSTADRTKRVLGKSGIIHRAKRTWALSATPFVNHPGELWVLLRVFGIYPHDYERFTREFCTGYLGPYGYVVTGGKNLERLRELLRPVMLRRSLRDVAPELARIEYSDYALDGTGFVAPAHELARVEAAVNAADPCAALAAIEPAVPTLRRWLGIFKAGAAAELLRGELEADRRKIAVFAVHTEAISLLADALAAFKPAVIVGSTPPKKRDAEVERFINDPACQVFIGNIVAAGTAIDLSVADDAVILEASWSPGDNAQAAMRIQNFNKSTPVFARFLSVGGTVDERIQRAYSRKARDFTAVFGSV